MSRVVKVTGNGKVSLRPDLIRLDITVEGIYKEYEECLSQSCSKSEALRTAFENIGFGADALKTGSFNVTAEEERVRDENNNWNTRFLGYKFTNVMKLEFDADNAMLGKVLYQLANCDANARFHITYTVRNQECVREQLMQLAVEDAAAKAKLLADAAGVKLGVIELVEYSRQSQPIASHPVMMTLARGEVASNSGYDINIQAEDICVEDSVNITWNIAD